jgi:hypothetical protein
MYAGLSTSTYPHPYFHYTFAANDFPRRLGGGRLEEGLLLSAWKKTEIRADGCVVYKRAHVSATVGPLQSLLLTKPRSAIVCSAHSVFCLSYSLLPTYSPFPCSTLLMSPGCTSFYSPAKSHQYSVCRARSTTTISRTVASSWRQR